MNTKIAISFLVLKLFFNCGILHAQLVYNNGALIAVKTGATVIIKTNSLRNASGTVDNAGTIHVEGSFTNDGTANEGATNGYYKIQNDWINNGTYNPASGKVELYGVNQIIGGSSITNFSTLTLSGSGIKTLNINANVNTLLELNDRELATNSNIITIVNTNLNAITRTTGFVSSVNTGRLARAMSSTGAYLFPVGSSIGVPRYRPVTISPGNVLLHQYEVRLANVDATLEGYDRNVRASQLCEINPNYYHLINRTSGNSAADVTFFYDPITDGTWATVAHWQNLPQWQNTGLSTPGSSPPFNTLTLAGWNDFTLPAFALANLGPDATITGAVTICQGQSATITFTGTPNAVVNFNINGSGFFNITLNALGQATINTGVLAGTTVFNLLNAYLPATPLCVQNFSTSATVTVIANPATGPIFHD